MARSKSKKFIVSILLMVVLISASVFSFTYAWFSDKKGAEVIIGVSSISSDQTVTTTLSPQDLIADNVFNETLNIRFDTDFVIYFRTYAIIKVQTIDRENNNAIKERTDLIDLINVSNSIKGGDAKYYYANNQNPQTIGTGNFQLDFTFKVSSVVSEDLFTKTDGTEDRTLKTTVAFHIEYCQEEGFNEWTELVED